MASRKVVVVLDLKAAKAITAWFEDFLHRQTTVNRPAETRALRQLKRALALTGKSK